MRGRRGPGPAPAIAAAALALALAAGARAQGVAVEGLDFARLLPPTGLPLEDYANAGYRLTWRDGEALVEVRVEPLRSVTPFALAAPISTASAADPVARLARALAAGARTRHDAVSRVLAWVSRNLRYDLDRGRDQSAAAVLARRSGYCTGVARLSVALLRALDIPAREVAGWVAPGAGAHPAAYASGFHRWIEVDYGDRGWAFSDPLRSHHYVPATYVRFAGERVADGAATGLVLARGERLTAVDVYALAPAGVSARRNQPRRLAAALEVATEVAAGEVELEGEGTRRRQPLRAGRSAFVGLAPGRYALRLLVDGAVALERRLVLPGTERTTLYLPLQASVGGEGRGGAWR